MRNIAKSLCLALVAISIACPGCSGSPSTDSSSAYRTTAWDTFYVTLRDGHNLHALAWKEDDEWRVTAADQLSYYDAWIREEVWYRQEHMNFSLEEMKDLILTIRFGDDGVAEPLKLLIIDNPAIFDGFTRIQYYDEIEYADDYLEVSEALGLPEFNGEESEYD